MTARAVARSCGSRSVSGCVAPAWRERSVDGVCAALRTRHCKGRRVQTLSNTGNSAMPTKRSSSELLPADVIPTTMICGTSSRYVCRSSGESCVANTSRTRSLSAKMRASSLGSDMGPRPVRNCSAVATEVLNIGVVVVVASTEHGATRRRTGYLFRAVVRCVPTVDLVLVRTRGQNSTRPNTHTHTLHTPQEKQRSCFVCPAGSHKAPTQRSSRLSKPPGPPRVSTMRLFLSPYPSGSCVPLWDIQHSTSAGVFAQAQRIQRDNREPVHANLCNWESQFSC